MPLNQVNNGDLGSTARTTINAAISQVDTNTTAIAGKQPLDADLTAIAALTPNDEDIIQRVSGVWAAVAPQDSGFQLGDRISTTSLGIRPYSASHSLLDGEKNTLFDMTVTGASTFTIPVDGVLTEFQNGVEIIIYNRTASTGSITITPSGTTILYANSTTSAVAKDTSARLIKIAANTWLRVS